MTETKYNMQLTETELKLIQNALHLVKCNEKKLLNKIEKKLDTINTKKQIDEYKKEQIKVEEKVEEFKRDPNSSNTEETDRAWFEYKQLLEEHKDILEGKKINKKYGETTYKNEYDFWKSRYHPSQINGKCWLKKLKKKIVTF
tara:strand:- start:38 stop:466 length:429 start_codon:yes stop_codon:yes gene_type:complete